MIILNLKGNTYGIRNTLKGLNFRWDNQKKVWTRTFKDSEETKVNELAHRWYSEGVYEEIIKK